jgi:hypothetical protein
MKQACGTLAQLTVLLMVLATSQAGSPQARTFRVSGSVIGRNPAAAVKAATKITLKAQTKGVKSVSTSIRLDGSFLFESAASGVYLIELEPSPDKGLRALLVGLRNLSDIAIPAFIPTFEVTGTLPTAQELNRRLAPENYIAFTSGPNVVLKDTDRSKRSFESLQLPLSQLSQISPFQLDGYFEPKKQFGDKLSRKGEFRFPEVPEGQYSLDLRVGESDVCCFSLPTGIFITVRDQNVALGTLRLK